MVSSITGESKIIVKKKRKKKEKKKINKKEKKRKKEEKKKDGGREKSGMEEQKIRIVETQNRNREMHAGRGTGRGGRSGSER